MNQVNLIGRITKDIELRRANNGKSVVSFTLAVNRGFKSADGQDADFISCIVWDKTAENLEKYCGKGSQVAVNGNLRTRTYDNAQGQKVYVTEVICNNVEFLNTKSQQQSNENVSQNNFYDMKTVDIKKEFDNAIEVDPFAPNFNIQDDDIQF